MFHQRPIRFHRSAPQPSTPAFAGPAIASISADGAVVVGSRFGVNSNDAFVWDATNGMRNVSDVLMNLGVDLARWRLTEAVAISADGTTIGHGTNPAGQLEAWLANISVVPEPSAASMALAIVMTFATGRRLSGRNQ